MDEAKTNRQARSLYEYINKKKTNGLKEKGENGVKSEGGGRISLRLRPSAQTEPGPTHANRLKGLSYTFALSSSLSVCLSFSQPLKATRPVRIDAQRDPAAIIMHTHFRVRKCDVCVNDET